VSARLRDAGDVTIIGPAAADEHGELREACGQVSILLTEFIRITRVEIGRLIELGVAAPRGVSPHPAQSLESVAVFGMPCL
jgi:hypothetical protein